MQKYAVLISGGVNSQSNYGRYLNDLTEMYKTLIEKYSYAKSNITVLYADGGVHDLDGDGASEIDMSAIKANVIKVFTDLQNKVTVNDMVFVFTTNHGGQITSGTNNARLWLWNSESISDAEFAGLINNMTCKMAIITMEQCFSGGFIDNLQGPNRIITTACDWNQVSYGCDSEGNYDEFVYHWTAAVRGKKPDGTAVDATGPDGNVSIKEAFDYAVTQDSVNETPQFYENPAGIGTLYTLAGPIIAIGPVCIPEICRTPSDLCPPRDLCRYSREVLCRPGDPCRYNPEICTLREPCRISAELCSVRDPCRLNIDIRPPPCGLLSREVPQLCKYKPEVVCKYPREIPISGHCRIGDVPCRQEGYIDPHELERMRTRIVARDNLVNTINQMANAGYADPEILQSLENMAQELEDKLREIEALMQEIQNTSNQHFRNMARR